MTNDFTKRVASTLGKHFVTLSCQQRLPGSNQPSTLVFSGFVVEILGEWFYITAGHIIQNIRDAIAAGATFDTWRLGDQTAAGNQFNGAAVPYDFDDDKWLAFDDRQTGLDYAILHLPGLYRRQLEVGGVQAIGKKAWSDHATKSDRWVLIGVPSESVTYDGKTIVTASVLLVPLVPADAPSVAGEKSKNQFYARLAEPSDPYFRHPDGLSGAPLFSLNYSDGRWLYHVIGVQSSWYSESRVMAACPFITFANEIEAIVAAALAIPAEQAGTENTG